MNSCKIPIFLVISAYLGASANTFTRQQCLQLAKENNSRLQEIRQTIKDADSKVSEAWGSAMPTLSFQGKYERAFAQASPFNARSSAPVNPFVNSGPFLDPNSASYSEPTAALAQDLGNMLDFSSLNRNYTTNASLVLTQILYAQGKVSTALDIAKSYRSMLLRRQAQIEDEVLLEVEESFDQVLFFREAVVIYDAGIEVAQSHLQRVNALYQQGLVGELQHLRAQLQVEDLKAGRAKMHRDLVLAHNALLLKMGTPWMEEVSLEGSLVAPLGEEMPDTVLTRVLARRNDIQQLNYFQEVQERVVRIARADYYPLLVAGGSLSKISMSNEWNEFEWQDDRRIFIQLQMNLFNGFQTREKVTQARTEVAKVDIQRQNAERGIKLQIESQAIALQDARSRLEVRTRMIDLAERQFKAAQTAFDAGSATQVEVLDASLELRKARLEKLEALLEWNLARNRLRLATGEY